MASPKTRGRMINRDISNSRGVGNLSTNAKILFCFLIPHFDSHGKMPGGPGYIKEQIVPYCEELTYDNIPALLREINEKTNVKYFELDGRWWIHSIKFSGEGGHQKLDSNKLGEDSLPNYPGFIPLKYSPNTNEKAPVGKLEQSDSYDDVEIPDSNTGAVRKEPKRKKKPLTDISDDFCVSDRVKKWADEKGFSKLQEHLESFKRKCKSKSYQYADWDSAFMEAIRENWAKLTGDRNNGNGSGNNKPGQRTTQDQTGSGKATSSKYAGIGEEINTE
jgi:hypothetical protein